MRPGSPFQRTSTGGRARVLPFVLRAFARAFASRLAILAVGALLLFFGLDARAQITCPSGQINTYTITHGTTCAIGTVYYSYATMKSACTPSHNTPYAPDTSRHWIGTDTSQTAHGSNGTRWDGYQERHNSAHGFLVGPIRYTGAGVGCAAAPDPCPVSGTPYTGNKNLKNAFGTTGYIQESPSKICEVVGSGGVCMSIPSGPSQGTYCPQWNYSGNTGAVASQLGTAPSETTESVCTSDGKCVSKTASNCGTVNGEYMCLGSPAAGGCLTTAGGRIVCTSTSSVPLTTPPAPASPTTPGAVATPAAQLVKPDGIGGVANGGQTTNIFNPGGAAAPGNEGTPTGTPVEGEQEGQGTCGGPGQPACAANIDCGGLGEPKCGVAVDETGVAAVDDGFSADLESRRAAADAESLTGFNDTVSQVGSGGAQNPGTGWSPGDLIPDVPQAACQTITLQFFNGESKSFPTPLLCDWIEGTLKPMLDFFLYVLTAGMIVFMAIRNMAPGGTT